MEALHLSAWSSIRKQLQPPLANTDPLNTALLMERNMVAWRGNIVVSTQCTVVPQYFTQFENFLLWRAIYFFQNSWREDELASLAWWHCILNSKIYSCLYSYNLHLKCQQMCAWKETQGYSTLQSFGGILCLFYFLATLQFSKKKNSPL